MTVWVLADLHLAFGNPKKSMEVFGPAWKDYPARIKENWEKVVKEGDLVLIPGDISWAMHLDDALTDLEWIDQLPGQKLMIKGNHDYWWQGVSKVRQVLPPTIHLIQNDAFEWNGISFGGSRLWDTHEYSFEKAVEFVENPVASTKEPPSAGEEEKIFVRELERLKLSLGKINREAKTKIALTHYPPIGPDLRPSRASAILEDFKIDICVFGHLHNVRREALPFGEARGVKYIFASADYLGFAPIKVVD